MQVQGINKTTKQIPFTEDQVQYLNVKLPKCFIFVPFSNPTKQMVEGPKIKNSKSFVDEQSRSTVAKREKDTLVVEKSNTDLKRQRTSKPSATQKQGITVPRSVYVFEEAMSAEIKQCVKFLQQLKKHPSSWPFHDPVDPIKLGIPTYFNIVKQPIDLGTIGNNLRNRHYETATQFHADISKMFSNSYKFNAKGSQVNILTRQFQNYYNILLEAPNTCAHSHSSNYYQPLKRQSSKRQSPTQYFQIKITKKKKNPVLIPATLTIAQKKQLGLNIRRLPMDCLKGVWQIVNGGDNTSQQLKFDIDLLSIQKARELLAYVNNQLSKNFGTDLPKQSLHTSQTMQQAHFEQSQSLSSFLSQESI